MVNEQECTKILTEGENKYSHEGMLLMRELITTLAQIEFDNYKLNQNKSTRNECDSLQTGKYRRAG
jgi:hypothetical protein